MVHTPDLPISTDHQMNPPFLGMYMEEDMGLKNALSGLTVVDLNAPQPTPRPVPVWFLNPEREERRLTYPSITINFLRERVAHEREHRGPVHVYYRYLQDIPLPGPAIIEYPIPMDFDYQITVNTRVNQHLSQISANLMQGPLHPRFAQFNCPGGTVRRLEILAMSTANGQEGDKRIFRHIYLVRVPTEVEATAAIGTRVEAVVLTIIDTVSGRTVYPSPLTITRTTGDQQVYNQYSGAQYSQQH